MAQPSLDTTNINEGSRARCPMRSFLWQALAAAAALVSEHGCDRWHCGLRTRTTKRTTELREESLCY